MWGFEEARRLAIETLSAMPAWDPIDKFDAARSYNVNQWFTPALTAILSDPQWPLLMYVDRLGIEVCLKLAEMRGNISGSEEGARCPKCKRQYTSAAAVQKLIQLHFPVEMALSDIIISGSQIMCVN